MRAFCPFSAARNLDRGAEVNWRDESEDPCRVGPALYQLCGFYEGGEIRLHAKSDRVKIVELLLEHGADVNLGDGRRRTPLHQALQVPYNARSEIAGQQAAIVQLLLGHNAAVDVYFEDEDGYAPIDAWEYSVAPGGALYHMRQTRDLHKLHNRLDTLEKLLLTTATSLLDLTKVVDVVSDDCTRRHRRRHRGRARRRSRSRSLLRSRSRSRSRSECRRGR